MVSRGVRARASGGRAADDGVAVARLLRRPGDVAERGCHHQLLAMRPDALPARPYAVGHRVRGRSQRCMPCARLHAPPFHHQHHRYAAVCRDSHAKSLYRAFQCFLLDFWREECATSSNTQLMQELANLPAAPGQSYCMRLLGPAGGRICMVHVVLGSSLLNNPQVRMCSSSSRAHARCAVRSHADVSCHLVVSPQVAEGGVLPLLRKKFASPQDIFLINFNVWHKKVVELQNAYTTSLEALGQYYQVRSCWRRPEEC